MDSKTARHLIDELSRSDATVAQWQALIEDTYVPQIGVDWLERWKRTALARGESDG